MSHYQYVQSVAKLTPFIGRPIGIAVEVLLNKVVNQQY
jgi:hypothetical protein